MAPVAHPAYDGGVDASFGEMLDTSTEVRLRYYAALRQLTPEQRARKAVGLSRAARTLALAGIRQAHPGAGLDEVRIQLALRLYGPDIARRFSAAPSPGAMRDE